MKVEYICECYVKRDVICEVKEFVYWWWFGEIWKKKFECFFVGSWIYDFLVLSLDILLLSYRWFVGVRVLSCMIFVFFLGNLLYGNEWER